MKLSLDIGGTNTRIAKIIKDKVIDKKIIRTPKSKKEILKSITELIETEINQKPTSINIAIAGMTQNGIVYKTPNLDFNNVSLKKILQSKFKLPVKIENDARCAGLAEKEFGSAKNLKNFFLLTLGTGIGGAFFIEGKLYKGNGIAPEPGHMLINGKEFEHIASGKASLTLAEKYGFKNITYDELESLAQRKNKNALGVYEEIGKNLGVGLLNISYVFDPQVIILGGGFAEVPFYWKTMLKTLHENDIANRKIKVLKAKLGDNAGLIGASLLD